MINTNNLYADAFKDLKDVDALTEGANDNFSAEDCAFENACDCLKYGEGKDKWNSCGLPKEKADEIWRKAFNVMGNYEISKEGYSPNVKADYEISKKGYSPEDKAKVKEAVNVMGDYEISKKGYSPEDKAKVKKEFLKESKETLDEEDSESSIDTAIKGAVANKATRAAEKGDDISIAAPLQKRKSIIEAVLDKYYAANKEEIDMGGKDYVNVWFEGKTGAGKTSIPIAWAEKNNINLVYLKATNLDETDTSGVLFPDKDTKQSIMLPTNIFNQLEEPNSVLFLDEVNRASQRVQDSLMEIMTSHSIPTYSDSNSRAMRKFVPTFIMTIVATNPPNMYKVDRLDPAFIARTKKVPVEPDPLTTLDYIIEKYEKFIAKEEHKGNSANQKSIKKWKNKIKIATALLSSEDFEFDPDEISQNNWNDGEDLTNTSRTITNALVACDGTISDFLNELHGNIPDSDIPKIKTILRDYKDTDDKANDALKGGTKSSVLSKKKDLADDMLDAIGIS